MSEMVCLKWRPPNVPASEEWSVLHQIVVPKVYQSEILKLAQESSMGGHLGINKTYSNMSIGPKFGAVWQNSARHVTFVKR